MFQWYRDLRDARQKREEEALKLFYPEQFTIVQRFEQGFYVKYRREGSPISYFMQDKSRYLIFDSPQQAEKWIKDRIKQEERERLEWEAEKIRRAEFEKTKIEYTVPPFRYEES